MKRIATKIILLLPVWRVLYAQTPDSIVMNPGYTHQVYYQLSDGSRTPVALASWDIGFQTSLMTASIIINESNVALYYADGADTSQYATLDVSNYQGWPRLYNSEQSWNIGAFNQLANPANQFDFGWGVYDFTQHAVFGTRLFVVETGGQVYKFWIRKKTSSGDYVVRFTPAVPGATDINLTIPTAPYNTKNFIYLKLATSSVVDAEPPSCCWHLLFTRYAANIPFMGYYLVTGVYQAPGVKAVKAYPVDVAIDSFDSHKDFLSTKITTIGYDWKYFDPVTMTYAIEDSLLYYVQDATGKKVWQLQFTAFDHIKGVIKFKRKLVYDATIGISPLVQVLTGFAFPNPATDELRIRVVLPAGPVLLLITDATGKVVHQERRQVSEGLNELRISTSALAGGLYQLRLLADQGQAVHSFMVMR
ncbi:MAG: T9SS type A sorting domain-containing protein [Chitinophagales bacterium]|nr:T9SS type A sorting domain-containing protein [Chitinophagales bacterium]MDW8428537.1 T9SS type A sorting domain-containing protein [Chitinophagales bacterium]